MKVKAKVAYRSGIKFQKNSKGIRLPGVTTINRELGWSTEALVRWSNRLGLEGIDSAKFRDDKADIGTLAHAMITAKLKGEELEDLADYTHNQIDKAENATLSYFEWEKDKDIEPILIEEALVSDVDDLGFGGMADIYAKMNGSMELIDLKTGSGIWPEHFVQVAAYRYLLEKNGHRVDGVRILNIPRAENENFKEEIVSNLDLWWKIFTCCLTIYQTKKLIKQGE